MPTTKLPPMDRVDPIKAWQPFKPDADQPFDARLAGHLLRRAAFGPRPGEIKKVVQQGPEKTIDILLQGEKGHEARLQFLEQAGKGFTKTGDENDLRGWWIYCMLHSLYPLRERLTLFWHDHFACSVDKVIRTDLMFLQNKTLRTHALGKFPNFLLAISKDPAMLVYLDSNSNVKGKPNENYAREVMELFSLGVGNYTETDIKEAAKAFTGWHVNDDKFVFFERLHDNGMKTLLGKTGNLNGNDVLDILLQQKVCAQFLVRKLYQYFVSESHDPPDSFLEPLADNFRKSGYDMKVLMKQMLSSQHFFSAYSYRQKIKSPIDFALNAVLALAPTRADQKQIARFVGEMGQSLFAPPNVKGWPAGKAWLNTSTVLARNNFAQGLVMGKGYRLREELFSIDKKRTPEKIVDDLLFELVQNDVREDARAKLLAFVKEGSKLKPGTLSTGNPGPRRAVFQDVPTLPPPVEGPNPNPGDPEPTYVERVQSAAQMILALPESQLA